MGIGFLLGDEEMFYKKIVVVVIQLCEHNKNHSMVYFKRVNIIEYELYQLKIHSLLIIFIAISVYLITITTEIYSAYV